MTIATTPRPNAASLAASDALTGVLSHRAWRERAEASAAAHPTWMAFMAVDGFGDLVARHGNQEADRLLAGCAEAWAWCLRDGDHLGRVGGPVFAATIRAHELGTVLRVAGRLRAATAAVAVCSVAVVRAVPGETAERAETRGTVALERARSMCGGATAVILDR